MHDPASGGRPPGVGVEQDGQRGGDPPGGGEVARLAGPVAVGPRPVGVRGWQARILVHPSPTGAMNTVVSLMERWSQMPSNLWYSSSS